MQNTPDYLYHYTSIETLALILANHTFRLTSLDQMDDLQEKEAFDLKNAGQFCYISSWTDDETENIPMWKMYSSLSSGVRIKLKANPFKEFENTPSSISEVTHQTVTDNSNGSYLKSIIPIADMLKNGFIAPGALGNNILHKVEYTSDSDKLYPKLLTQEDVYKRQQFHVALRFLPALLFHDLSTDSVPYHAYFCLLYTSHSEKQCRNYIPKERTLNKQRDKK